MAEKISWAPQIRLAPDPENIDQAYKAESIRTFLDTVEPGQRIALLDFDGTVSAKRDRKNPNGLGSKGIADIEDIFFFSGGIPSASRDAWAQSLGMDVYRDDSYLVTNREVTRNAMARFVTPELHEFTGIPVGEPMSVKVMEKMGEKIGGFLLANDYYCPEAVETIQLCQQNDIRVVILTATPTGIAKGVMETFAGKFGFADIPVLGTEQEFDENGESRETLWMKGGPKRYVAEQCLERGARLVIGAGDNPGTPEKPGSDGFIRNCEIPVHAGPIGQPWQPALDWLKAGAA